MLDIDGEAACEVLDLRKEGAVNMDFSAPFAKRLLAMGKIETVELRLLYCSPPPARFPRRLACHVCTVLSRGVGGSKQAESAGGEYAREEGVANDGRPEHTLPEVRAGRPTLYSGRLLGAGTASLPNPVEPRFASRASCEGPARLSKIDAFSEQRESNG